MNRPIIIKLRDGSIYLRLTILKPFTVAEALDLSRRLYKCAVDPSALDNERLYMTDGRTSVVETDTK